MCAKAVVYNCAATRWEARQQEEQEHWPPKFILKTPSQWGNNHQDHQEINQRGEVSEAHHLLEEIWQKENRIKLRITEVVPMSRACRLGRAKINAWR